ncbi:MAG: hypothetical protein KKA76_09720, partial [Proteobacteria bacterium]|nr:hypothetical protein [Pseudomonadota bacterium]
LSRLTRPCITGNSRSVLGAGGTARIGETEIFSANLIKIEPPGISLTGESKQDKTDDRLNDFAVHMVACCSPKVFSKCCRHDRTE